MTDYDVTFSPVPDDVRRLLSVCPVYRATPLVELADLADRKVLVKDETDRMNLGAFKGLGGPYAVARLIGEQWEAAGNAPLAPEDFLRDDVRAVAGAMTFVTASAGNHGVGVAAGAQVFGAKARIYLSAEVPASFDARLESKGAEVVRSGSNYAESVEAANQDVANSDAILLADGSWPGYIRPPSLILEGYTVIGEELRESFEESGDWPSHVFLQAGVGGLASGVAHMIRHNWAVQPVIYVVEPDAAPCLKASHEAGKPVQVEGPTSNMGRLDCKEPSIVAFAALEAANAIYLTVSDDDAQQAADDITATGMATTPSGAAGLAGLRQVLADGVDVTRPLIVVSEGAV